MIDVVRAYEEISSTKNQLNIMEEYRSGCNGPHSKCGCHLSVAHGFESHLFRHAAATSIGRKEMNSLCAWVLFFAPFYLPYCRYGNKSWGSRKSRTNETFVGEEPPTALVQLVLVNGEWRRSSTPLRFAYPALRLGRIPSLPPFFCYKIWCWKKTFSVTTCV